VKAVAYLLVVLSLLWIDVAYRTAMALQPPRIITVTRIVRVEPSNYVVPAHECSRTCRAKFKASLIVQREGE
jgi:hypothetical protein